MNLHKKKRLLKKLQRGKTGKDASAFDKFRVWFLRRIDAMMPRRKLIVTLYVVAAFGLAFLMFSIIGHDRIT